MLGGDSASSFLHPYPNERSVVPTPKFRNGHARRLRVLSFDFDGRRAALNTTSDPPGALDETHARMRESLRSQFGIDHFDAKLMNYMDLGPKPMSVRSVMIFADTTEPA